MAVAAALFLVVGALSLGLVLTAEAPELTLEDDNTFQEGDRFNFDGQTYTVTTVEASESGEGGETTYEAVIEWQTDDGTQSTTLNQHTRTTLGDEEFFAHFESGEEVTLSANTLVLNQYTFDTEQYNTHTNGLWGVTILSGIVAILLMGIGYMPSRY
ncbi:hypothetical protein JCM30237_09260 [Halolamina litorea]